jgi:hypothetical protein
MRSRIPRIFFAAGIFLLLPLLLAGCYSFSGSTLPSHLRTIQIHPVENKTLEDSLPDRVTREAYSQEVASAGFWAGGATAAEPFFYGYAYPEPAGYRDAKVVDGRFDETYGEFVLSYGDVRSAADPAGVLSGFLQSAYDVAADLARWDRAALEREPVTP